MSAGQPKPNICACGNSKRWWAQRCRACRTAAERPQHHCPRPGCTRMATRNGPFCAQCNQAQRKQQQVEQAKAAARRFCPCGTPLSIYSQRGLCAGCAGREALAGYREGRLPEVRG